MPKRPAATRRDDAETQAAPAVVLPFPARAKEMAAATIAKRPAAPVSRPLPEAPVPGERPTFLTPTLREWLRAALIVSVAVHAIVYLAFELRFEDDLERAAGAAAALSTQGTVTIPIEIVVEAALPSAPSPTNATATDAKEPEPEQQTARIEELMPPPPEPAPVVLPRPPAEASTELPVPPEPAPVVLPTREQAARLALPEEATAPSRPVEIATIPESPPAAMVIEERPPLPPVREPIREERKREPEKKQTARSSPSAAASPNRAAAANSTGSVGAGGVADTGGRAAISSYQAQVLAHLSRHRVYPPEARDRGATGVARVRFALTRDGRVMSASLVGGSGERVLDEAALDMVRRASPFPPFPSELTQSRMDFAAPIRFDLR
ncbi:MAG: TonB family protein [Xanthobacteraceae bacterium]